MKKNFLTGLIILIPVALTFVIIQFLINLLTTPFIGYFDSLFDNNYWLINLFGHNLDGPISKLLILLILPAVIIAIGFFGRMLIVTHLLNQFDKLASRIPFINGIYLSIKEAVNALLKPKDHNYSRVVLVPFPHPPSYCFGFITCDDVKLTKNASNSEDPNNSDKDNTDNSDLITVFVPGTPNPTGGFMLIFRKDQVIHIDMKVEDALKSVVSCGLIFKNLTVKDNSELINE